jgi:hypothetical protein
MLCNRHTLAHVSGGISYIMLGHEIVHIPYGTVNAYVQKLKIQLRNLPLTETEPLIFALRKGTFIHTLPQSIFLKVKNSKIV